MAITIMATATIYSSVEPPCAGSGAAVGETVDDGITVGVEVGATVWIGVDVGAGVICAAEEPTTIAVSSVAE